MSTGISRLAGPLMEERIQYEREKDSANCTVIDYRYITVVQVLYPYRYRGIEHQKMSVVPAISKTYGFGTTTPVHS